MTKAPDFVYIGPAMDIDGEPTWDKDWVQIGDWDISIDGLTFAEHGKRFVDADLHAALMFVEHALSCPVALSHLTAPAMFSNSIPLLHFTGLDVALDAAFFCASVCGLPLLPSPPVVKLHMVSA